MNVAQFIEQFNSYEIHKSKLDSIKKELENTSLQKGNKGL